MGHFSAPLPLCLCGWTLLWTLCGGGSSALSLELPKTRAESALVPWPEQREFIPHQGALLMPPFLLLPLFRHAPAPLAQMELFRPVAGRRSVPSSVARLLTAAGPTQRPHAAPRSNAQGVELWCGHSKVSVRLHRAVLGTRGSASHIYLGTCPVSRSEGEYLYFYYELKQCGSSLKMQKGHIVYSNNVLYRPEAQHGVIREVPLTLPVQCLYNRFHYAYKIGYSPEVVERTFQKSLGTKRMFVLSVRNEKWDQLPVNASHTLGEPVYFEAAATLTSEHERVFVDSCHVTADGNPNSTPHYVISNFGCMVDSRSAGSQSRFISRQSNILRFSLDAFLFPHTISKFFYLHCTISVGKIAAQATAKSCTYTGAVNGWKELDGDDSVCTCCNYKCEAPKSTPSSYVDQALVTSDPLRFSQVEIIPEKTQMWTNTLLGEVQEEINIQDSEEAEEVLRGDVVYDVKKHTVNKMMADGNVMEQGPTTEVEEPNKAGDMVTQEKEKVSTGKDSTVSWNASLPTVEKKEEGLMRVAPEIINMENLTHLQRKDIFSERSWNDKAPVKENTSHITEAENLLAGNMSALEPREPMLEVKSFLSDQYEPAERILDDQT